MSEEKLNEKYICEKTLLDENDELVPIIRKMLSEAYINGLEQSRFDKRMLEQENQQLKEKTPYLFTDTNWDDLLEYNGMTWINIDSFRRLHQQRDLYKSVINEIRNHCEVMLKIFEKMNENQRDKNLDKFKIYDYILRILDKANFKEKK